MLNQMIRWYRVTVTVVVTCFTIIFYYSDKFIGEEEKGYGERNNTFK